MKNKFLMSILAVSFFTLSLVTGCGSKESTNGTGSSEKVNFIDSNKSYFIIIDGKKFYAGDKISALEKVGYSLRASEKYEELPANKYMIGAGHMLNSDNKNIFDVTPFNTKGSSIKVSEAVIGGIDLSYVTAKNDSKASDFEVYGGIKLGTSEAKVKEVFGEPSMVTDSIAKVYRYESEETYRSYKFTFNENGEVSNIQWQNLVFNK